MAAPPTMQYGHKDKEWRAPAMHDFQYKYELFKNKNGGPPYQTPDLFAPVPSSQAWPLKSS